MSNESERPRSGQRFFEQPKTEEDLVDKELKLVVRNPQFMEPDQRFGALAVVEVSKSGEEVPPVLLLKDYSEVRLDYKVDMSEVRKLVMDQRMKIAELESDGEHLMQERDAANQQLREAEAAWKKEREDLKAEVKRQNDLRATRLLERDNAIEERDVLRENLHEAHSRIEELDRYKRYEAWACDMINTGHQADILMYEDWINHVDDFDPEK